jgi:hypothetical protein
MRRTRASGTDYSHVYAYMSVQLKPPRTQNPLLSLENPQLAESRHVINMSF